VKRLWIVLAIVVTFGFTVLGWVGSRIYQEMPPIPERIVTIACVKWAGQHHVRAVIQIAHGLGEHMGRYAELAETLVHGEFVVYGNDHRGHGLTAKPSGSFGDFGPGGFDQLVEDMVSLRVIAKKEHPGKPYILLGHSMGSFAAQQFVLDHGHSIDGLVLSGSGTLDGLARLAQSASGGEDPMKLMNAAFEPARTPLDWLSRDTAEVDAFIADPLCFPSLKARSMESFLDVFPRLADPREIRKVRTDLPIYVFSGSDDPIGQKAGRSACARRPLPQRGYYINRARFLSRRSARNASRTESP
jgi:alpha-beta hydrolase superfamily lysophospholipase